MEKKMTQFGVDVSTLNTTETLQHQYDTRVATYGPNGVRHTKIFGHSPGKTNSPITPLIGSSPVYCFSSWNERAFQTFLPFAPRGSFFCYKQEAENKLLTPADLADYHNVYARMAALTATTPFSLIKIGMHYQEDLGGTYPYKWADLDGGQFFPNLWVGIDCYSSRSLLNQHGLYESPMRLFESAVAWHHNTGLPVAIPEFGALPHPTDDSHRETFMLECIEYARAQHFDWINWWDTMGNTPADNYLLAGTALQPIWKWATTL